MMKKNYFILLLITTGIVSIANAQEVPADIKFFTTEGYTNNSELNDNANWQTNHVNASNIVWSSQLFCSETFGYQRLTANYARSHWQTPIQATANQTITLRLDFDPSDGTVANTTNLLNFGLISASGIPVLVGEDVDTEVEEKNNEATYIKTDATGKYTLDSAGDGSTACVIGERTYVVVKVTVGTDAASSIFSAQLFNAADAAISETSVITGIATDLYTAITGTGAYTFFASQNFKTGTGFKRIDVSRMKVSVNETPLSVQNHLAFDFSVYPNPAKNEIKISTQVQLQNAKVSNLLGKTMLHVNYPSERLDVSSLHAGIYLMSLTSKEGVVVNKKIIIE